jgi:NAD+ diphosphatase
MRNAPKGQLFAMDLHRDPPNFFSGPYIDRRAEHRELATWLESARADASTQYVVAVGTTHLLLPEPEPHVLFLTGEHPIVRSAAEHELVLLGWFHGSRCLLVEIDEQRARELPQGARFEELRPLSSRLPAEEAGLLAYARALSIWRARHRFCGVCGSRMLPERAGHVLRCSDTQCSQEVFPRIDPAIIVLVTDGERALLGRSPGWPAGRYSTIAGFVEPGESLEDAVAREVFEETGVPVTQVNYQSSQPWPFPSSLMVGFQAVAPRAAPITVGGELEDARWFSREEIATGTSVLPTPHSISYRLIETWFNRDWPVPLTELRKRV